MKSFVRVTAFLALSVAFMATSDAQLRFGKLGVGVTGSMLSPMIDNVPTTGPTNATAGMAGGLSVMYSPWQYIGMKASAGVGQFTYRFAGLSSKTTMAMVSGYATLNAMPNSTFNPFVGAGLGYHYYDARRTTGVALLNSSASPSGFDILVHGGFDYFLSEFFSVSVSADYAVMQTDGIDGYFGKGDKDGYLRAGLEIRYYFFDQAFLTRMLEALKSRYEN